jgi:hypothetical protein
MMYNRYVGIILIFVENFMKKILGCALAIATAAHTNATTPNADPTANGALHTGNPCARAPLENATGNNAPLTLQDVTDDQVGRMMTLIAAMDEATRASIMESTGQATIQGAAEVLTQAQRFNAVTPMREWDRLKGILDAATPARERATRERPAAATTQGLSAQEKATLEQVTRRMTREWPAAAIQGLSAQEKATLEQAASRLFRIRT